MYTDEEVGKSVQRFLKNHEFFEHKAFRQNRVPKSLERIQSAITSNVWQMPQLLVGDRVLSV